MAINLLGSTNSSLDYGDLAAIAGLAALSVAIRFKATAATASNRFFIAQWQAAGNRAFRLRTIATDEIHFSVQDGAGLNFGKETTGVNLASGSEFGIVATWVAGTPGTIHIVVDGVDEAVANSGTDDPLTLRDAIATVNVGRSAADGPDGDYSEAAIWSRELPVEVAKVISNGVSPLFYGKDMILYDRMVNTSSARDIVGGIIPSIAAGINAAHPSILMPSAPIVGIPTAAAAAGAIMNQFQGQNMGADLYNGTLL